MVDEPEYFDGLPMTPWALSDKGGPAHYKLCLLLRVVIINPALRELQSALRFFLEL